jgi:hypothetical protein
MDAQVPSIERPGKAGRSRFIKADLSAIVSLSRLFHKGKVRETLGDKLSSQVGKLVRSRAAAGLLLLVLTAHAFVAGATHFHRVAQSGANPTQVAFRNGEERGGGARLGGDDKQCLLCRLQRNLVSDLQQATLVIAPPPAWTPGHEHLHETAARPGSVLLRQGRAPPSVQS